VVHVVVKGLIAKLEPGRAVIVAYLYLLKDELLHFRPTVSVKGSVLINQYKPVIKGTTLVKMQ